MLINAKLVRIAATIIAAKQRLGIPLAHPEKSIWERTVALREADEINDDDLEAAAAFFDTLHEGDTP